MLEQGGLGGNEKKFSVGEQRVNGARRERGRNEEGKRRKVFFPSLLPAGRRKERRQERASVRNILQQLLH